MTPHEFIQKWFNSKLKERSAAQEHFVDLCRMLAQKTPAEADPDGVDYAFEYGAAKTTGGRGFADVFKRGHFGWEYKGTHANLDIAFAQLQRYAIALDNPPLLIVSDIGTAIRIYTNWTNSISKTYEIAIADLGDPDKRQLLLAAFNDPEELRPKRTRQQLTEEVAGNFADLARSLQSRRNDPLAVAHFVNRLVFCMFAEDVKLLPDRMFGRMIERALEDPNEFVSIAGDLFRAMRTGGRVGFERVAWFNGGLFDDDRVFPLTIDELRLVHKAASQYWGDVDPSILGTLFERGLDPQKRGQLGAHYTDREKIMMIVEPVIVEPLMVEWEIAKRRIVALMDKAQDHDDDARRKKGRVASAAIGRATAARKEAQGVLERHLKRLAEFRVLDPACGSGNFLYLALRALKDLEHRSQVEAEALGLPRRFPSIGPEVVKGIEINPYAAELARVSVWIGEIQWMLKNGFPAPENPVLRPLETIECRDALLQAERTDKGPAVNRKEASWPTADVIIGNPPFLGSRKIAPELTKEYAHDLRVVYRDRVSPGADLVCFWFGKTWQLVREGKVRSAGLIATNSISSGSSRKVLEPIADQQGIFDVRRDQPWIVEGAAVDVSLICFSADAALSPRLNGERVERIFADLHAPSSANARDVTLARVLHENSAVAFQGVVPRGSVKKSVAKKLGLPSASFVVPGDVARRMLAVDGNPSGRGNAEVVVPFLIGDDITKRPRDRFIVDFGVRSEAEAELYEAPFAYIAPVRSHRAAMTQPEALETWWQHWRTRQDMRSALKKVSRFIATPRVAKHRVFVWRRAPTLPDNAVVAIARDDDTTFGILHSKFHQVWALRKGSSLQNRPRYTSTTTFATFPFPVGLTPDRPARDYANDPRAQAIAAAGRELDQLRSEWLNPKSLVEVVDEVVEGFPHRVVAVNRNAAAELRKRTLTNLYNVRPAWLTSAHRVLDEAVAAAYGVRPDQSDDAILQFLLSENLGRTPGPASTDVEEDDVEEEAD